MKSSRNLAFLVTAAVLLLIVVVMALLPGTDTLPVAGPTITPTLGPPPAGVLLTFTRRGGTNDACDDLTITTEGITQYRNSCQNTQADGKLADPDAAFLQGLAMRLWRYQYISPPSAGGGAATITLQFFGAGAAPEPSTGEQARLLDIAQTAADTLRGSLTGATPVTLASLDEIQAALAGANGDRNVLRNAIGQFLALPEIRAQTDQDAAVILQGLISQALVYPSSQGVATVQIVRLGADKELALVNQPLPTITLYAPGGWTVVIEGTHVVDTRLEGDRLGVISVYESEHAVTGYTMLQRSGDQWRLMWNSADAPDWQSMDGSAAFAGAGLASLQVLGMSYSPMTGEADPPIFEAIPECAMLCSRRYFSATWTLAADGSYARASRLAAPKPGEPIDAWLWDETVPDEYSATFEFLRRLRAGDTAGTLQLATQAAVDQAIALGLNRREMTVENTVYQLIYVAGKPDQGQIRLRPLAVRTLPSGEKSQHQFEGTFTVTLAESQGSWQVTAVEISTDLTPVSTP